MLRPKKLEPSCWHAAERRTGLRSSSVRPRWPAEPFAEPIDIGRRFCRKRPRCERGLHRAQALHLVGAFAVPASIALSSCAATARLS
jgi:hypothetical protein